MTATTDMGFAGLRVALVGPVPPPSGGMANQTRQLGGLLGEAGARVEMVATNAPYRPAWAAGLPGLRALFRLLPYLWALWRAAGRADLMHLMANSGWSWHLFAVPALWVAWLRGCPVLVNYRGGEAGDFLVRSGRSVAFSLRRADALLVPSGFLQAVFARHGIAAEILPNVVDLQRFRPAAVRPAEPRLLVARNLEALYDNASAIRALALLRKRHPHASLTIAGTGPELERLQALVEELGLGGAVRFAGRVERDAMAELYRASMLSINPSLADNMPNSVLESLASGVPVVSTNVGGVPHLVQHEHTALLVPARDPAALADALVRLIDDPALYEQLRAAGLAEVQRYTWVRIGPQLAALYKRSLRPASARRPAAHS